MLVLAEVLSRPSDIEKTAVDAVIHFSDNRSSKEVSMCVERKSFSEVFGDRPDKARPEVTLRRMTDEDRNALPFIAAFEAVGIYWGRDLIAVVDFDELYDPDGNRFYND